MRMVGSVKVAIGIIGVAGLVCISAIFAFFGAHTSQPIAAASSAICAPSINSQDQDQIYFVGCGGLF